MSVRDYNATPSSNTTISSIDIAEGCSPSGINNAIRQQMADLKDVSTGTVALESPKFDSILDGNIKATDASGTDTAGTATTIKGGAGTGTGAGGSIVFQVADGAGSTGSSVNAHATAMTITDDGNVDIAGGLNVGTIKEATGATTAMTIDSSGLILTPARPAFHVVRSSSMSASGVVTYNAAKFNIGSHMNISTGLFTAPISGIYLFTFQCIYESANGFADVYAKLNGTVDSGVWSLRPQNPQQTTFSSLPSASILLQLTADDTLGINSTSALYSDGNQWVRFSGCLIG